MTTRKPKPPPTVPVHPDDKTCDDCKHIKRCKWLLSYTGAETQCDWTPSKFRERSTLDTSPS